MQLLDRASVPTGTHTPKNRINGSSNLSHRLHEAPRHVKCGPACAWGTHVNGDCPWLWADEAIEFAARLGALT